MFPERVHYRRDLYSLTSSMFLHVSRMHLLGNMLILNIFVDNLEDEMGHCWFFYISSGIAAGLLQDASDLISPLAIVGYRARLLGLWADIFC